MLKFSNKPTGWFQIAWSGEIPPGGLKPLKYFDQDLVAFRTEAGQIAVLDAHCKHLGAHLGYGGKVKKNCVACPYHGWEWDEHGANSKIPYQDQPIRVRLRKWDVQERHGLVFLWFDPVGGPPRHGAFALPDLFTDFPDLPAREADYYPCWPNAVVDRPDEPIAVQAIVENGADAAHFKYTHGAPLMPELLSFDTTDRWRGVMGFKSPKTGEIKLKNHGQKAGIGASFNVFEGGGFKHRLILTATPVTSKKSHVRISYFFARDKDSPDVMPQSVLDAARQTQELYEEDARIWRHQKFVQRPVFAEQDVAGYTALRKWSAQFYETPEADAPWAVLDPDAAD